MLRWTLLALRAKKLSTAVFLPIPASLTSTHSDSSPSEGRRQPTTTTTTSDSQTSPLRPVSTVGLSRLLEQIKAEDEHSWNVLTDESDDTETSTKTDAVLPAALVKKVLSEDNSFHTVRGSLIALREPSEGRDHPLSLPQTEFEKEMVEALRHDESKQKQQAERLAHLMFFQLSTTSQQQQQPSPQEKAAAAAIGRGQQNKTISKSKKVKRQWLGVLDPSVVDASPLVPTSTRARTATERDEGEEEPTPRTALFTHILFPDTSPPPSGEAAPSLTKKERHKDGEGSPPSMTNEPQYRIVVRMFRFNNVEDALRSVQDQFVEEDNSVETAEVTAATEVRQSQHNNDSKKRSGKRKQRRERTTTLPPSSAPSLKKTQIGGCKKQKSNSDSVLPDSPSSLPKERTNSKAQRRR